MQLTSTVDLFHLSKVNERTLDTWTPNPLWTPEHSMHNTIPRLILAHCTSVKKE